MVKGKIEIISPNEWDNYKDWKKQKDLQISNIKRPLSNHRESSRDLPKNLRPLQYGITSIIMIPFIFGLLIQTFYPPWGFIIMAILYVLESIAIIWYMVKKNDRGAMK